MRLFKYEGYTLSISEEALALKPYMDFVVNGTPDQTWSFLGKTIYIQTFLAAIIPFGIVAFALFQGVLKYASNYLTDWTGNKISNSLKVALFRKLTGLDPQFYDVNSSGLVLQRFLTDPETASKSIIESLKSFIANVFGLVGDTTVIDEKQVRANPYVENVQRVSEPYKKVNRIFHNEDSIVDVSGIPVGGSQKIVIIGGPCSIESEVQTVEIAEKEDAEALKDDDYNANDYTDNNEEVTE